MPIEGCARLMGPSALDYGELQQSRILLQVLAVMGNLQWLNVLDLNC